jgi:hypothetical protein
MSTPLAIDTMTIEEKLEAMEALWNDLRRHEDAIDVHEWQKHVLDERQDSIVEGTSHFIDWEQAKEDIARETS